MNYSYSSTVMKYFIQSRIQRWNLSVLSLTKAIFEYSHQLVDCQSTVWIFSYLKRDQWNRDPLPMYQPIMESKTTVLAACSKPIQPQNICEIWCPNNCVQYNNYISWQHSANTESLHQTQWPSNSDSSVQLAVH